MTDQADESKNDATEVTEVESIVTSHRLELAGSTLAYTATVGKLPLKDEKDKIVAQIFYTAYTLDTEDDRAARPLIFVFNGGPGSASIWLHMGALGPKRVDMGEEGFMPPPPFKLIDNAYTWLDLGDLVFIDPVGTGYSRASDPADNEKYWGLEEDLEAVGEFIRLYLSREKRWTSPLYLAGESYGTTRAAGLAGHLIDRGIAFNGIVLLSTVMNFQTLRFTKANDLPYALYLPSFCATAHYHGMLDDDLQKRDLRELLREAADWAEADYTVALAKGDRMSAEERAAVAERLAHFTGLSQRFIQGADLRVNIMSFCKELLREDKRAVGRLDSRFIGIMASAEGASFRFRPVDARDHAALYRRLQSICTRAVGLRNRPQLRNPQLQGQRELEVSGRAIPRYQRGLARRLGEEPLHARARGAGLLRFGDALPSRVLLAGAYGAGREPARQYHD